MTGVQTCALPIYISGFKDLPVPVQKVFAAGMGSVLQGKTQKQVDNSVMLAAVRAGVEALGNAMDANAYFKEKMGREPTAEELNKFTWYTDRSQMQKSLDNYAKVANKAAESGINLTDDQVNKILTSDDPIKYGNDVVNETVATTGGWTNYAEMQDAKNLGISTPADYKDYIDEHTITLDEARQISKDAGYQLSDDQLAQYVGRTPDPEQITRDIQTQVDPLVVDQKEVIDEFAANLGRYPTQAEIDKYVGVRDQAQTTKEMSDYIESIAIRPDEVNQAFQIGRAHV